VLPANDQHAMLRTTYTTYTEDIDARIVVSTLADHADPFSVATESVWTDAHITLTHSARTGTSALNLEWKTLELVISLCRPGINQ
jgi:hypothetical protein